MLRLYLRRGFASQVLTPPNLIRNVAIIAHVDHGKTTTVDNLVRQSGANLSGSLDCNELERERGITILSKSTRINWKGHTLNLIDTPGHASFGGETERVMSMIDGAILIVDMSEGPKPQTKFVLKKALAQSHIRPLVVVNKVDRVTDKSNTDIENEIFDLFCSLDASDAQLEYPILYASAKQGWAVDTWDKVKAINSIPEQDRNMHCILDAILKYVPSPVQIGNATDPFSMLVTTLEQTTSNFGMMVTGKVYSGNLKKNDSFVIKDRNNVVTGKGKARELSYMAGLERVSADIAGPGDIISISLAKNSMMPNVTDTIAGNESVQPLPSIPIDPPVIAIKYSVNSSPLAGVDGKLTSLEAIRARLRKEALQNPAIDVQDTESRGAVIVKGRGELQLGVLIETMRREGFEMTISPPEILMIPNPEENGPALLEPWEEVIITCQDTFSGVVSEKLITRDGELLDISQKGDGTVEMRFNISSRNFIGMREVIRALTRSDSTILTAFKDYRAAKAAKPKERSGVIVSFDNGMATKYDMEHLVEKGSLFIKERDRVYTGMIVGENVTEKDLDMVVAKGEDKGDVRRKHKEKKYLLPPAREMPIEACLAYIDDDEEIEVTPLRIAMRKKILDPAERRRIEKKRTI
jgi:GTP-binding protein